MPSTLLQLDVLNAFVDVQSSMAAGISLNITAVISGVFFILVWVALKFLLFDPYVEIVEDRDEQIVGARDKAVDMETRAGEVLQKYESRLQRARVEASQRRDELREQGEIESSSMLSDARRRAQEGLSSKRAEIERELAEASTKVEREAHQLSKTIVERVLATDG